VKAHRGRMTRKMQGFLRRVGQHVCRPARLKATVAEARIDCRSSQSRPALVELACASTPRHAGVERHVLDRLTAAKDRRSHVTHTLPCLLRMDHSAQRTKRLHDGIAQLALAAAYPRRTAAFPYSASDSPPSAGTQFLSGLKRSTRSTATSPSCRDASGYPTSFGAGPKLP
jgi:hypothetical protein